MYTIETRDRGSCFNQNRNCPRTGTTMRNQIPHTLFDFENKCISLKRDIGNLVRSCSDVPSTVTTHGSSKNEDSAEEWMADHGRSKNVMRRVLKEGGRIDMQVQIGNECVIWLKSSVWSRNCGACWTRGSMCYAGKAYGKCSTCHWSPGRWRS